MGRGKLSSPWPSVVRNCYGLEVKVDNAAAECNREPAVCTESLNCSEEQEWIWRSQKAVPMDQEALSRVCCHPKALYQAWKQAFACKGVAHCKGNIPGMSTSKLWDSKSCHSAIKEKKKWDFTVWKEISKRSVFPQIFFLSIFCSAFPLF